MDNFSVHELLARDARRVFDAAPKSCSGGILDADICDWYHGAWPLMRVLGMVSNPYWHYPFFEKYSRESLNKKHLVLATADSSLPMLLHSLGVQSIDVFDACSTPLNLCTLTSERLGANWRTFQGDVLNLSASDLQRGYGVIANDAFLTRFADEEKIGVLKSVSQLLDTNGMYVSTARVAADSFPSGGTSGYQSDKLRKQWFIERATSRFIELGGVSGFTIHDVAKIASNYMRAMVSYRFSSVDHLHEVVQASGLTLLASELVTTIGESEETTYVRFACRAR